MAGIGAQYQGNLQVQSAGLTQAMHDLLQYSSKINDGYDYLLDKLTKQKAPAVASDRNKFFKPADEILPQAILHNDRAMIG